MPKYANGYAYKKCRCVCCGHVQKILLAPEDKGDLDYCPKCSDRKGFKPKQLYRFCGNRWRNFTLIK
jgi:hypothetical protein